jgi:flagellar motor switch protein FliN/FliY
MTPLDTLGTIARVPLEIEAVLDRRIMSIESILDLEEGSTIRMNRSAGENIDLVVGGATIGYGEIVVVENMMCVRVTDFMDQH